MAVAQNGNALQHAHDDLKKDPEVVKVAVSQNGAALRHAHEDFKKGPVLVKA